ncbi:MAG: hypothetical protein CMC75_04635 [Flavobacteriaceae bacterium]|nr:hypothetical protein [Flavobacteriaceae bacterium]
MNSKEILTSIKELVGLSKEEVANEVEATEEVILSTEVVAEEVIEEKVEEVELSTEETKEEVIEEAVELAEEEPKKEAAPAVEAPVQMNFATQEELSQVKQELLSMIKAMMEDKSDYAEADVPAKLSAEEKEAIELSEVVEEEVVHSPESVTESKQKNFNNKGMTAAERVWSMINN